MATETPAHVCQAPSVQGWGREMTQMHHSKAELYTPSRETRGQEGPAFLEMWPNHLDITEFSHQPFPEHPIGRLTKAEPSSQELHWSDGGNRNVIMWTMCGDIMGKERRRQQEGFMEGDTELGHAE